jgi:[ribosomal protein S5]-alanine N-acetyltransferase
MLPLNSNPFPMLTTARLVLKPLELSDAPAIFALRSNDEVNQFIGRKKAESLQDAKDFIQKIQQNVADNTSFYWGIHAQNPSALVGTICLWNLERDKGIAEIGYELLPDYQGNGFAQEALRAVIDYAFSIDFTTITACLNAENAPSIRLLERNNFKKQGILEEYNELIYTLTLSD